MFRPGTDQIKRTYVYIQLVLFLWRTLTNAPGNFSEMPVLGFPKCIGNVGVGVPASWALRSPPRILN
jgi:hypothetical protein